MQSCKRSRGPPPEGPGFWHLQACRKGYPEAYKKDFQCFSLQNLGMKIKKKAEWL